MKTSWLRAAGAMALFAATAAFLPSGGALPEAATRNAGASSDATREFLERHWRDPLPPQGEPPAGFSALEASLDPESCGQCHARQFLDWKSSLHSKTMGPGILWQFHVLGQGAANGCMRCHAPLAEQKALLALERHWQNAPATPPPAYVAPGLHRQGLVCAACHVRRHERVGPPPRQPARASDVALPHGGFSASVGFQDSRFCGVCHQFSEGGLRLNGKFLENTLEEWSASTAAKQGRSCQSCHMPDRRHLWRGIHDPDMVRKALRVSLEVRPRGKQDFRAQAELANTGAGHHFPTYLVPEVVATLELVDAGGTVRSELARRVIGRNVNLELTREISDTRIASGERMRFGAQFPAPDARGWSVVLRVVVYPGKHYERLFRSVLERPQRLAPEADRLLREALGQIDSRGYELYRVVRAVPPPPG